MLVVASPLAATSLEGSNAHDSERTSAAFCHTGKGPYPLTWCADPLGVQWSAHGLTPIGYRLESDSVSREDVVRLAARHGLDGAWKRFQTRFLDE